MAKAIRKISIARGHDVTRYTLACFGGAGGQHACSVADALGMERILVHPLAGVLSAYGIGLADVKAIREASVLKPLGEDFSRCARRSWSGGRGRTDRARHACRAHRALPPRPPAHRGQRHDARDRRSRRGGAMRADFPSCTGAASAMSTRRRDHRGHAGRRSCRAYGSPIGVGKAARADRTVFIASANISRPGSHLRPILRRRRRARLAGRAGERRNAR